MINFDENLDLDLRQLSHSKCFKDLCEDDTEAFTYGIYYPRVKNYMTNANIKKKNPTLYNEIESLNVDTIDYIEPMFKLMDDYIDDGEESLLGVINYILENLEYNEDSDRYKMAFVLGIYLISGELERVLKGKLDKKLSKN